MVLWPEAALPWMWPEGGEMPFVSPWARKTGGLHLVGAVSLAAERKFVTAVQVGADGAVRRIYRKRQLVPFGEFVPSDAFRRFIGILNELGGMSRGPAVQELWDTPLGRTAVTICYEATFPAWSRQDAARGARALVNITNDGWYKDTVAPVLHFHANRFRAIENRATVARAGNTGISGLIDPWGRVIATLGLNERGRLDLEVPVGNPFPEGSFYSRRGDWLGALCLALAALLPLRRPTS